MNLSRILMGITALFFVGCSSVPRNTVTQVSTIDALLASVYDGQEKLGDLLKYGDFGIGTFDRLDGEMIVLEGEVYQAKSTGEVFPTRDTMTTPFACVVHFQADQFVEAGPGAQFKSIQNIIDQAAPNQNLFYAIRIDGTFSQMNVRAVPAQEKPYPPLTEVAKNQPEFNYSDLKGTIVGFRCPAYVKGINVPGYHLHFISDDREKGGHILDFTLEHGSIQLDQCDRFFMKLPHNSDAFESVDLSQDRSKALHAVER